MTNTKEIYVIADNIRSLYNVGSLFRLCDGVGVKKLYLCGTTGAPFNRLKYQRQRQQIAKTALAGLGSVEWEYHPQTAILLRQLRRQQIQLVAIEQAPRSVNYTECNYAQQIAVIVGNEVDGVSPDVLNIVDIVAELPMLGRGKSLNVVTAASAVLYHIRSETTVKV